jgi:S-formylglutathione hydrolase FrmB
MRGLTKPPSRTPQCEVKASPGSGVNLCLRCAINGPKRNENELRRLGGIPDQQRSHPWILSENTPRLTGNRKATGSVPVGAAETPV